MTRSEAHGNDTIGRGAAGVGAADIDLEELAATRRGGW